ncbi:methyltransferase family protein [Micromonospora pisi]|uniref:Methyltransferase family protein n=1 Tax=Micromonospora pisi TaxID=589240 RepID=A0A495JUW4_9ACTN|nr:class I SAM-dependent methyltransferase [Micromonospora pisi]RKR92783.1 methyltransferase family protein [Micromonospora pisi]
MYNGSFYDTIRAGTRASAAAVVPVVVDIVKPATVIDVGCGEGWWADTFAGHGCEVIGVDGAYVTGSPLGDRFIPHDLALPLPAHLHGRFDLAVCLEVAEHLPPSRADSLVDDLCNLAPTLLFSAAIPGQGGVGHVNEQWPNYWVTRFKAHGWSVSGALRWSIWNDDRVENWYRQNLLVATRTPEQFPELFDTPLSPPWPVVHPVLYDARRH